MERNIAALMREDTFTVRVSYRTRAGVDPMPNEGSRLYTYIGWFPLRVDQDVVVIARAVPCVARVVEVDDSVKLEPGDTTKYGWIVCPVETEAFDAQLIRNDLIERTVAEAYQRNLRRSFAQTVLGQMTDEDRVRVQAVLGAPAPKAEVPPHYTDVNKPAGA